jgi:hypothetical protein
VKEQTPKKGRPGNLVTWAVDRLRAVPWFGDKKMQLLKALAFEASDQLDQIVSTVKSTDATEAVAKSSARSTPRRPRKRRIRKPDGRRAR